MTIEESIEQPKQLDAIITEHEHLEYDFVKPGKKGPKKTSKSTRTMIKHTEFYIQEKRRYKQKSELYKLLRNRFSNHNLKPHQRQLAIQEYTQWLENLTSKNKVVDVNEEINKNIDTTYIASAHGPGGQNVNKLATKVRLYHTPTHTTVESVKERSQPQNLTTAKAKLSKQLQNHLDLWLTCFPISGPDTPKIITPQFVEKFISEEPTRPTTK